jgi:hypothetical protein
VGARRGLLGRDARWLVYCAIGLNVLLFIRVALLSSPFYSYQGPSGADRVYYYAYTRSIVIDHDLDFTNEFAARPPTSGAIFRNGRQLNKYPIGTPILSLPAFAVAALSDPPSIFHRSHRRYRRRHGLVWHQLVALHGR